MFDLLAHAYRVGKIDRAALDAAVTKGWVTDVQVAEIVESAGAVGVLVGV